ncbi:hypothetical protein AB0G00_16570 [Nocardia salmonicida]|uniref:hypothetical protein n=1 Tax=Nocardia salmonicida TaxID=53431 RepID=UPI0033C9FC42
MSGKGFGNYLTDEHKARHLSEEAAQRRVRIREAIERGTIEYNHNGVPLDPAGTERGTPRPRKNTGQATTENTPPTTRRLTGEGAHHGERGNESGFGRYVSGDAPATSTDAAQREAASDTAGRGFGRYL